MKFRFDWAPGKPTLWLWLRPCRRHHRHRTRATVWAGRGAARTGPAGSLRADQHLRHRPGRPLRAGAVPPASISSRGRGGRDS